MDEKFRIRLRMSLPIYIFMSFYLFSTVKSVLNSIGLSAEMIWGIMAVVLYIPLLLFVINEARLHSICYKNILLFTIIVLYIAYCAHTFNYSIYSHETNGINAAILTGCTSIFALLFVGLSFDEYSIDDAILYTAIINFILVLFKLRIVMSMSQAFLKYGYDMDFGYKMLFSCMVFLSVYLRTNKKKFLFMTLVCLVLLAMFGSRGPIICIVVYLFLYYVLFKYKEYSTKKKTYLSILFGLLLIFVVVYYLYIAPMIDMSGLPRNVRAILNIRYSEGTNGSRTMIQNKVMDIIRNNGFFGSGLLSDQAYLGSGFYSHNLLIELQVTFGRIPGIIIAIYLILRSVYIFRSKNISDSAKNIYLLFMALSMRLMVSYSFWYDLNFWCFIALGNIIPFRAHYDKSKTR